MPSAKDSLNAEGPSAPFQVCVARELNELPEEEKTKKTRQQIPEKIMKEVGDRANK